MRTCRVVSLPMLVFHEAVSAKTVIPVWPHLNDPPGRRNVKKEIQGSIGPVEIRPIRVPALTEFPAPKKIRNGCAIMIGPGGTYSAEAMALEGYRVARRFNSE